VVSRQLDDRFPHGVDALTMFDGSAVATMMDAEALRGQMTTGTLGFTPL
jgi:hypothetical protein